MKKFTHIKRLYRYILSTFIPLFLMTFVICLFIVLMQFLWKYVEDMVGKGLGLGVIAEMFLYAALNLITLALPLSILLASLMVFGNFGEKLELLAMKSAGIPLLTTMKPLIILVAFISVGAFFFQNNALPKIQTKFYSLLLSIREAAPELDIPEGVFYKEIDGYNLYVGKKNRDTGMLYNVMIYDVAGGFNNMAVIVCDSAKMSMTEDKKMLIFTMYNGQQFQNFTKGASVSSNADFVPYARENFDTKSMMISYDANFNRLEENVIEGNSSTNFVSKNLSQLGVSIDSMSVILDSVNLVDRKLMRSYSHLSFRNSYPAETRDSIILAARKAPVEVPRQDTLLESMELSKRASIIQSAFSKADNNSNEFVFRSMNKTATRRTYNRYWVEWHRKFTIPFTCLVFFFIGAPLGSIVRKGGLGTPIVISVILFIVYYIMDNVGYKMTRDGVWAHWFGMWFSSMVLLPIGVFFTYKAMNDSVIMNTDTYVRLLRKLFFVPEKRHYPVKSVVIEKPNYAVITGELEEIKSLSDAFIDKHKGFSYKNYWINGAYEQELKALKRKLEVMLDQLSNARNLIVLSKAEEFPVLINRMRLFAPSSLFARISMWIFPVGVLLRLISYPFEVRIGNDLKRVSKKCSELMGIIKNEDEDMKLDK